MSKLDKLLEKERNKYSQELFGKNESELQIAEILKLDQYIYDLRNPIWKPIIIGDIDTKCKVSNTGEIIDPKCNILKKYKLSVLTGYYYQVYVPGIGLCLVHRLVAQAFIPNPENKPQVNHINGNKRLNWWGNLEWNTAKENSEHAWRTGLVNNNGELQGSSIYSNSQIIEVCKLLEAGKLSYHEISEITNVSCSTISDIRCNREWRSISKNFKMPPIKPRLYSDKEIETVCKLLEDPTLPHQVICNMTGVSINTIKDIMKKTSYRRISDKYNIQKRINAGVYSPISKYSEKQIRDVCKMLENPLIPVKDISNITNVKIGIIYDIRRGTKWKSIAKEYNIPKINV